MNIKVSHSGNIQIDNCMSLIKNIIYIDNPFVLDEINGGIHYRMPVDHKYDLINKLSDNNKDNDFDALDKILVDEKLKNIIIKTGTSKMILVLFFVKGGV